MKTTLLTSVLTLVLMILIGIMVPSLINDRAGSEESRHRNGQRLLVSTDYLQRYRFSMFKDGFTLSESVEEITDEQELLVDLAEGDVLREDDYASTASEPPINDHQTSQANRSKIEGKKSGAKPDAVQSNGNNETTEQHDSEPEQQTDASNQKPTAPEEKEEEMNGDELTDEVIDTDEPEETDDQEAIEPEVMNELDSESESLDD